MRKLTMTQDSITVNDRNKDTLIVYNKNNTLYYGRKATFTEATDNRGYKYVVLNLFGLLDDQNTISNIVLYFDFDLFDNLLMKTQSIFESLNQDKYESSSIYEIDEIYSDIGLFKKIKDENKYKLIITVDTNDHGRRYYKLSILKYNKSVKEYNVVDTFCLANPDVLKLHGFWTNCLAKMN